MLRLGGPDKVFITPRKLNSLCALDEVHVGYEYRGFIQVRILQIEEKKV